MSSQQLDYNASDEILAEITRLRAENTALKLVKSSQGITLKVSAKGAVSVYGMGRWPVTLYAEQWTRLIGKASEIETFIQANQAKLSVKADKPATMADQVPVAKAF